MLELQNRILEMIARGALLETIAQCLCSEIEQFAPGVVCSILTVNADDTVHTVAAPKLPADYVAAIEGLPLGPANGACGTATYLGQSVSITDMRSDPRWGAKFPRPPGVLACWSSPIFNANGRVIGTFAFYYREARGPTDVERGLVQTCVHLCAIAIEHARWQREHISLAYTDPLTKLPNLAAFNQRLSDLSENDAHQWGMFIVDLANLKSVNDALGHTTGDVLLEVVASRLADLAGPGQTFRIDGNTFAVFLTSSDELCDLDATAGRILLRLAEPANCGDYTVTPRATIGGALSSQPGLEPEQVRKNARFALHYAKETAGAGFVPYVPNIGARMVTRLEAIRNVSAALRDDRIEAFYQPIVCLQTGETVGFEALARLRMGKAFLPAGAFHAATTDAHIARDLTSRMLHRVSTAAGEWLRRGLPFQHIAINVSSSDFHGGGLIDRIANAFSREQVPLDRVVIEITESVYLDRSDLRAGEVIHDMRQTGMRVALDDFGTGYASLNQLLTVSVDFVKLDRSFIENIATHCANKVIVEGLLRIASGLNASVIGEGIEKTEQFTELQGSYCNLGQGYLFSPAVNFHTATEMLRTQSIKAQEPFKIPPAPISAGNGSAMNCMMDCTSDQAFRHHLEDSGKLNHNLGAGMSWNEVAKPFPRDHR